jgi:hypothetical protein
LPSLAESAFAAADGLYSAVEGDWTSAGISLFAAGIGIVADAGAVKLGLTGAKVADELRLVRGAERATAPDEAGPLRSADCDPAPCSFLRGFHASKEVVDPLAQLMRMARQLARHPSMRTKSTT